MYILFYIYTYILLILLNQLKKYIFNYILIIFKKQNKSIINLGTLVTICDTYKEEIEDEIINKVMDINVKNNAEDTIMEQRSLAV